MKKDVLTIQNFSKTYNGNKKAVDNLSISVKSGEIHGFIGHNGAGKTTVIRSVAGVMNFEDGDIYIDGHSVRTEPVECKSVTAYIPDNPDLYEYITGIQYLNFMCDMFSVDKITRKQRIDMYAQMLGISDSLSSLIGSYSHGMKQKLALIGAFAHKPKLMVLDEPFVGLDPEASFQLKNEMRKLCDDGGAIFFSTHVLDVAEKLCDKITIIKGGKLVAAGTLDDIKSSLSIGSPGKSLEDVFLEVVMEVERNDEK